MVHTFDDNCKIQGRRLSSQGCFILGLRPDLGGRGWGGEKLGLTGPYGTHFTSGFCCARGGPPSPGLRPTSPRGGEVQKTKRPRHNGFTSPRR